MINRAVVPVTDEQERTALAWLAVLHDQPDSGDQATFSRWLQARSRAALTCVLAMCRNACILTGRCR